MNERKLRKSINVPIEAVNALEAAAINNGTTVTVVITALVEVLSANPQVFEGVIQVAKEENIQMRRKVASDRANIAHARRKALQVQQEGVE